MINPTLDSSVVLQQPVTNKAMFFPLQMHLENLKPSSELFCRYLFKYVVGREVAWDLETGGRSVEFEGVL